MSNDPPLSGPLTLAVAGNLEEPSTPPTASDSLRPSPRPMLFAEHKPPEQLEAWVECLWHFLVDADAREVEHWVPPDGSVSLSFARRVRSTVLIGPFLRPMKPEVGAGDEVWGVRLRPEAGAALLGVEGRGLRDLVVPASTAIPGQWIETLDRNLRRARNRDQAFSAYSRALSARVASAGAIDDAVRTVVQELEASGGHARIGSLATRVGLSGRHLRRRFRAATGLSAKEFARIRRFRSSGVEAILGPRSGWADLASAHGFADQSHLVREYRRMVGLPPEAFVKQFASIDHELLSNDTSEE